MKRYYWLAALTVALIAGSEAESAERADGKDTQAGDATVIRSFLTHHCVACHGPTVQRGDLRLDTLATDFSKKEIRQHWQTVLDRVVAWEMPPPKKPMIGKLPMKCPAGCGRLIMSRSSTMILTRESVWGRTGKNACTVSCAKPTR